MKEVDFQEFHVQFFPYMYTSLRPRRFGAGGLESRVRSAREASAYLRFVLSVLVWYKRPKSPLHGVRVYNPFQPS